MDPRGPSFPTAKDWEQAGRPGGAPLVLIDGECVLCHWSARFILRWEQEPTCLFAALGSAYAALKLHSVQAGVVDGSSVVVLWQGRLLERSEAVLQIAGWLRLPWSLLRWSKILPLRWRDAVYDFIARHRRAWLGSTAYCQMLSASERRRFAAPGGESA